MLTHIHIWNFAIVEQLDIEFESGLTVLTGETGAGKSILLDALNLALGDRADTQVIRHGSDKAEISVSFSTQDAPKAEQWLREHDMQSAEECIIRRTISQSGPSRAFINGIPATIIQLRELGEMLVDLHGQHEHQSLLHKETQREVLDQYAGHHTLVEAVAQAYREWHGLEQEFQRLNQIDRDRDQRLELLRHQVAELTGLALQPGEYAQLDQDHKRLANAAQLLQTLQQTLHLLSDSNDNDAIESRLALALRHIQELASMDDHLSATAEMLNTALIQIEESSRELNRYLENLDLDPERLAEVEQRLSDILQLSRKHRSSPEALTEVLPQLQTELEQLENADLRLAELEKLRQHAREHFRAAANKLSKSRGKVAKQLNERVSDGMQSLSLQGGSFAVQIDALDETRWNEHGGEQIEFLVSANPGQPLRPLHKVASGGELSRISLAIQVITAQTARIPTLIFDEVDVGIGGRVAEIVGLQLRTLGQRRQVICVTHLPQVAALGHHHLQVSKRVDKNATLASITSLDTPQRIDEVARMLGGIQITDQTRLHAREMIERAQA